MIVELLTGDCMEQIAGLPDESIHCCVTSPPYWGLRDYGTATWEGGNPDCDHAPANTSKPRNARPLGAFHGGTDEGNASREPDMRTSCHCGATRIDRQLGLEESPEEYVAKMVDVFRAVRRVLRDDGTLWLNIGDSYAGSACGLKDGKGSSDNNTGRGDAPKFSRIAGEGIKPKDLVGIPWMLAFALRADGWYLRQDIIWHKPNPMPESVRDRCTKAHEYVFLLSNSQKYFYDYEAIKEDSISATNNNPPTKRGSERYASASGVNGNAQLFTRKNDGTRNKRSVWTVTTKPYPEAHFATFPPKLIEPCILAGCPVGGTVLDPFSGSGTTGFVAIENGRSYIGVELNPEYQDLAKKRIAGAQLPLFAPGIAAPADKETT